MYSQCRLHIFEETKQRNIAESCEYNSFLTVLACSASHTCPRTQEVESLHFSSLVLHNLQLVSQWFTFILSSQ